MLHLGPSQFAMVNVVLTLLWIGVAFRLLRPAQARPRMAVTRLAGVGAAAAAAIVLAVPPASAQDNLRRPEFGAGRVHAEIYLRLASSLRASTTGASPASAADQAARNAS